LVESDSLTYHLFDKIRDRAAEAVAAGPDTVHHVGSTTYSVMSSQTAAIVYEIDNAAA